jgi:hypothetical protein
MQGLATVVSKQYEMFRSLVTNFELLLDVDGPISAEDVTTLSADMQRITLRSYSATRVSIRNFAADFLAFRIESVEASPGQRQSSARGRPIGLLFLSAIESISIIAAERDSFCDITSDKLPPVIPRDLANIAPREFNEVFFSSLSVSI